MRGFFALSRIQPFALNDGFTWGKLDPLLRQSLTTGSFKLYALSFKLSAFRSTQPFPQPGRFLVNGEDAKNPLRTNHRDDTPFLEPFCRQLPVGRNLDLGSPNIQLDWKMIADGCNSLCVTFVLSVALW